MSQTENIAASAAKLSSSWRDEVNQIRTRLNSLRARSCWDRGVNGFALDLLDSYEEICEYCKLGNGCELGDGCKVPKSLFISASQHSVSYWGYDAIQIGCKKYTISEWQKHFREIGKAEDYSEEQIDEYGSYIDLIAKLHGRWNIKQK